MIDSTCYRVEVPDEAKNWDDETLIEWIESQNHRNRIKLDLVNDNIKVYR